MSSEKQELTATTILDEIKNKHVVMRPKWHFVLWSTLAIVGGICMWLTVIYLVSFIFFILYYTGVWFTPALGSRGWYIFFRSLPWLLILLLFVFVIILEVLVRTYAFAYRRPLLYSVGIILLIIFLAGSIVSRTSFHRQLFTYAEKNRLPFAGQLYRSFGQQHFKEIHPGTITKFNPHGFDIKNRPGEILTIIITPETRFLEGRNRLSIGNTVVVMGQRRENIVEAWGVKKVDE
jgi:hypothetical protein